MKKNQDAQPQKSPEGVERQVSQPESRSKPPVKRPLNKFSQGIFYMMVLGVIGIGLVWILGRQPQSSSPAQVSPPTQTVKPANLPLIAPTTAVIQPPSPPVTSPTRLPNWRTENIEVGDKIDIKLPAHLSARSTEAIGTDLLNPAISPDHRYLLIEKNSGEAIPCHQNDDTCYYFKADLWLYDFTANEWQVLAPSAIKGVWSPDGSAIAYLVQIETGQYDLAFLSLTEGVTRTVVADVARSQPYWRDDDRLIYLDKDGYVTQAELDGSNTEHLSSIKANGQAVNFVVSLNGSSLAIVDERQLYLIDLKSSSEPVPLNPQEENLIYANIAQGIAWSPDGQYLAYASGRYFITVYDKGGALISNFGAGESPHSLSWSPDGNSIAAVGSSRNETWELETFVTITNKDGTNSKTIDTSETDKFTLDWASNGLFMVWATEFGATRINLKTQ